MEVVLTSQQESTTKDVKLFGNAIIIIVTHLSLLRQNLSAMISFITSNNRTHFSI